MTASPADQGGVGLERGRPIAGPASLAQWLAFIEQQHPRGIDLGLARILPVQARLGQRQTCPVVIVGGTNGKGSTCALLESILLSAGYRVGLYTSPHLLTYNERVRVNGVSVADEPLCAAFARVHGARGEDSLTYFEYGTLAAWEVFAQADLDVIILEVGLGGRLDATNLYDADVAVVTGVDIDHTEFLGATREEIGFEKAGIFRPGRVAVYGDKTPPARLLDHGAAIGADLRVLGRDFTFQRQEGQWLYRGRRGQRAGLGFPALRGPRQLYNASTVLTVLEALSDRLPVAMQEIRHGLATVNLPGRFQVLPGRPAVVLDVAHNPQAATVLSGNLGDMEFFPRTWAVIGMMADKDVAGVIAAMAGRVDQWLPCSLPGPRGMTGAALAEALRQSGIHQVPETFESPAEALARAQELAGENDRIVAFGSFLTVADAMRALGRGPGT